MGSGGIEWTGDLTDRVNQFGPRVKRAMVAAAKFVEPQALAYMKNNAPWTDRTSNARNGLSAKTVVSSNNVTIVLYHTVPYGVWLELKNSGRHQIIRPTIEQFAGTYVQLVSELAFD